MSSIITSLIFLLITLSAVEKSVSTSLCSTPKTNNSCVCQRIKTDEYNIIVLEADCSAIGLRTYPADDQLPDDVFDLDLSFNNIETFTDFYHVDFLEILDLSYNQISKIEEIKRNYMPLRRLILSHNKIDSLTDPLVFNPFYSLEHLDLSFNNIATINPKVFLSLPLLRHLNIGYNNQSLGATIGHSLKEWGITTNLTHLSMENLNIPTLNSTYFAEYKRLTYLNLADNYLEQMPKVPDLVEHLDVSGTLIAEIQPTSLTQPLLRVLKLNRLNKLQSVPNYAFINLKELEQLEINDCRHLTSFSERAFGDLSKQSAPLKLKQLSLARNRIESLGEALKFAFKDCDKIDLTHNPWRCDCGVLWLQEFTNLQRGDRVQCDSPVDLYSKQIGQLVDTDLKSCFPEKYGKRSHRIIISLLLLAMIVLSALIGYLIYYAPKLRSVNHVGPESPYSC